MYQHLYSEFLKRNSQVKHFACHSHHYWPDVTRDAMLEYWEDTAKHVDNKWSVILGEKVPETQKLIAANLRFSRPQDICFSSSTHDFVVRLISALDFSKPVRILTTDSEFYSFERQMRRLEEDSHVQVTRIPTEPFQTFEERFEKALKSETWDMVYMSHVFFNSGVAVKDLNKLANAAAPSTMFVVDGYHSYFALPVDLSTLGDRIYFIAGGYKYAQSGEGCCFITLPKNCKIRPAITSWFADMGGLENFNGQVGYSDNGYRVAGATLDYTALYRMRAVLKLFDKKQITIEKIHQHVQKQQNYFLDHMESVHHPILRMNKIVWRGDLENHGHFLTYDLGTPEDCAKMHAELKSKGILTDYRKSRLRFGFSLYHDGPYNLFSL